MPDPDQIPLIGPVYRASTIDEAREVPILGGAIGTIGAVTNFVEYGCYPHWTVWADTFWRPFGILVIQIFSFGWGDILRGYFRPTNIRGIGGRTRRPTRGTKNKPGKKGQGRRIPKPPEIGNEIGKALPGSKFFQGRKVTGFERRAWVIDGVFQRIFYYWLIADVTEDFVTNWTTAIMESEACRKPDTFNMKAHKDSGTNVAANQWSGMFAWTTDYESEGTQWNALAGTLQIPAGSKAHITFWARSHTFAPNVNEGADLRISVSGPISPPTHQTPWPVNSDDNPQEPTMTATILGPCQVSFDIFARGTGLQFFSDAVITAGIRPA
jgi:hypothetical protein